MDGNPVLQIVRCRLGTDMGMDSQGYPFPMAAHSHSHSHLPHPASHAHFPRLHYPHPCGTPKISSLVSSHFFPSLCALVCIVINRPTRVYVVFRQGQRLRRLALSTRKHKLALVESSLARRFAKLRITSPMGGCCLRICRGRGEIARFSVVYSIVR